MANSPVDKRPLTTLQMNFIEAYFESDQNMKQTVEKLKLRSTQHGYSILKSPRVQFEVAKRKKSLQEYYLATNKFEVSKEAKMQMLWNIALMCTEKKTLKSTGEEVLKNPEAAIKAIHELNLMVGHLSPEKIEVKKDKPTRTEEELLDDVNRLVGELQGG